MNCGKRGCHKTTAKGYKMLEESISAYKDDAGRCSEACPAHVALRAAYIRRSKVAQRNHWDYFILPRCTTPFRKQASSFPNVAARAEQKLAIYNTTTSQANEQAKNLMEGITSRKS